MATAQQALVRQEGSAACVRYFQPFMIPGPLQTARFARSALLAARVADETGIDEAVAARLERGDRLRRTGEPRYHVILTELALRWRPLDVTPEDHIDALRAVQAVAEEQAVTVQVIT